MSKLLRQGALVELAIAASVIVIWSLLIPSLWIFGPYFAALAAIAFWFLYRSPVEAPSGEVKVEALSLALRLKGYTVKETSDWLLLRDKEGRELEVRVRYRANGAVVYAKPSSSSNAILLILFTLILGPLALVVIIVSIWTMWRADRLADTILIPILSQPLPTASYPTDDPHRQLLESLSQARALASDAERSAVSLHQDVVGLSIIVAIFTYIFFFAVSVVGSHLSGPADLAIYLPIVVGVVCGVIVYVLFSPKRRRQIRELRQWLSRFDISIAGEIAGSPPEQGESSLELLMVVFDQIPAWVRLKGKSRATRHPVLWIVGLFLVPWAASLLISGITGILNNGLDLTSFAILVVAIGLMLGSSFVYHRIVMEEKAEEYRTEKEWERRREYLRQRIQEQLEGN
ncbi:MAG TPA: hypothetical protein VMB46_03110 [Methanomassiliicoccales archaeon]|nr:hypothetical protein [Methanomassiliicoccales archaeon]